MFSVTHIISSWRSTAPTASCVRSKSTTSAIKAGLRAESSSRTRSRFGARTNESGGGDESRSRTSNWRSRYTNDHPFDTRVGSRDRRPRSSPHQRAGALRTFDDVDNKRPRLDSNGLPLSRRERRAAFWEQKQAESVDNSDGRGVDDELVGAHFHDASSGSTTENEFQGDFATHNHGRGAVSSRRSRRAPDRRNAPVGADDDIPIKYTTAASQFLYGANVVVAALSAQRRKIYHLYMHKRAEAGNVAQIRRAASALGVPITRTANSDLLERMSEGRPHNGVVLEVSPLPARPAVSLGRFKPGSNHVNIVLAPQSAEDVLVNGIDTRLTIPKHRAPVVVFLDGITDPGNVGSILRTAHFFGIDAVVIATQTCAPLSSAVLAKASSGACEAVPILQVAKAGAFVKGCADQGWSVCAAVAPEYKGGFGTDTGHARHQAVEEADSSFDDGTSDRAADLAADRGQTSVDTVSMVRDNLLADNPRLLLLGAEGEGLRGYFKRRADILLTVPGDARAANGNDVGVDSMNVGVAAGILMHALVAVKRSKPVGDLGFDIGT